MFGDIPVIRGSVKEEVGLKNWKALLKNWFWRAA